MSRVQRRGRRSTRNNTPNRSPEPKDCRFITKNTSNRSLFHTLFNQSIKPTQVYNSVKRSDRIANVAIRIIHLEKYLIDHFYNAPVNSRAVDIRNTRFLKNKYMKDDRTVNTVMLTNEMQSIGLNVGIFRRNGSLILPGDQGVVTIDQSFISIDNDNKRLRNFSDYARIIAQYFLWSVIGKGRDDLFMCIMGRFTGISHNQMEDGMRINRLVNGMMNQSVWNPNTTRVILPFRPDKAIPLYSLVGIEHNESEILAKKRIFQNIRDVLHRRTMFKVFSMWNDMLRRWSSNSNTDRFNDMMGVRDALYTPLIQFLRYDQWWNRVHGHLSRNKHNVLLFRFIHRLSIRNKDTEFQSNVVKYLECFD
jgi:hypothetical protein